MKQGVYGKNKQTTVACDLTDIRTPSKTMIFRSPVSGLWAWTGADKIFYKIH